MPSCSEMMATECYQRKKCRCLRTPLSSEGCGLLDLFLYSCRIADWHELRMPVQYIVGNWDFRHLTLQMQQPVLIPRPETERLVELAVQHMMRALPKPFTFLEIGCGSGAISLSLLYELPGCTGTAIDRCTDAVALTRLNAARLRS